MNHAFATLSRDAELDRAVSDYERDGFIRVPGLLSSDDIASVRAALARYYLSKVPPGEDLQAALALMDACGIGERSWSPR